MTWVKLDDGFGRNPKTRAAGLAGRGLYVIGLCWSSANLTDGFIPAGVLSLLNVEAEVKPGTHQRLVDLGLWDVVEGGWQIHDFLHYNRSRRQVEQDRARWRGYKNSSTVDSAVESSAESNGEAAVDSTMCSAPSRPVPSRPVPNPQVSTDVMTLPKGAERDGGIANAALLEACLNLEIRQRAAGNDPVDEPAKWKKSMRTRRWAQWGADITHYTQAFPEAPADVIAAAVVNGEKHTLRYYAS